MKRDDTPKRRVGGELHRFRDSCPVYKDSNGTYFSFSQGRIFHEYIDLMTNPLLVQHFSKKTKGFFFFMKPCLFIVNILNGVLCI